MHCKAYITLAESCNVTHQLSTIYITTTAYTISLTKHVKTSPHSRFTYTISNTIQTTTPHTYEFYHLSHDQRYLAHSFHQLSTIHATAKVSPTAFTNSPQSTPQQKSRSQLSPTLHAEAAVSLTELLTHSVCKEKNVYMYFYNSC